MAIGIVRLLDTNLAQLAASIVTASSQNPAFSANKLRDQSLGASWRSALGWTIVAGFNDKIDFNRGGVKAATITPGTYATGAAMAAAIVTALEAIDATPVWASSYSGGTFKFTISSDLAFTLLFSSGTNVATSVHLDLGYTTSDKASAVSQVAENTSFQSRHYILVDLGSALPVTAAAVRLHNAAAGGTFTLYGKTANNPWVSPGAGPLTLGGNSDIRLAFLGSVSLRYWAIVINDVQNTLGYAEVGIASPYTYRQPTVCISVNFEENIDDRSTIDSALSGTNYQNRRQRQRGWAIEWADVDVADQAILDAFALATVKGTNFLFSFDAVAAPSNTVYVFRDAPMTKTFVPGGYYTYRTHITESVP